jgi:hypothetical protein
MIDHLVCLIILGMVILTIALEMPYCNVCYIILLLFLERLTYVILYRRVSKFTASYSIMKLGWTGGCGLSYLTFSLKLDRIIEL